MQKEVINSGNDNKANILLKRFREEKRTKRREKLLLMDGNPDGR